MVLRIGILQTALFGRAVRSIASGDASVVLVVGGEAKASGNDPVDPPDSGDPDVEMAPGARHCGPTLEVERGLAVPAQSYALQEDAVRRSLDESASAHRGRLADLWSSFSQVATANPYARGTGSYHDAGDIADPMSPGNRMVSSPYTKRHCSQWNVDQAVAILAGARAPWPTSSASPAPHSVFPVAVTPTRWSRSSARAQLFRAPAFDGGGRAWPR